MEKKYDVTLSFAGEDRDYVEKVANTLHEIGIKVFYDNFEQVDLWGKNLYTHLDDVYQNHSRYCVMFISKYYKEKMWTNHERESAQARAFLDNEEYILPVRFDDTEIPGVRLTIGYISLKYLNPEDLAFMIAKKVNPNIDIEGLIETLKYHLPNYTITVKDTNLAFLCEEEEFYREFSIRLLLEMENADELENMFIGPSIVPH